MTKKTHKYALDRVYTEEGQLQSDVMEWLAPQRREGIKAIRICDRYNKGYSDVFICVRGIFVCAELKDDTGTPTPHQIAFLKDMKEAGAVTGICRSIKDVANLIDEAKKRLGGN